jgi:hypothetical protein
MRSTVPDALVGTRHKGFLSPSFSALAATVLLSAGLSTNVVAQVIVPEAGDCPADTVGQTLNCTANDRL